MQSKQKFEEIRDGMFRACREVALKKEFKPSNRFRRAVVMMRKVMGDSTEGMTKQ